MPKRRIFGIRTLEIAANIKPMNYSWVLRDTIPCDMWLSGLCRNSISTLYKLGCSLPPVGGKWRFIRICIESPAENLHWLGGASQFANGHSWLLLLWETAANERAFTKGFEAIDTSQTTKWRFSSSFRRWSCYLISSALIFLGWLYNVLFHFIAVHSDSLRLSNHINNLNNIKLSSCKQLSWMRSIIDTRQV